MDRRYSKLLVLAVAALLAEACSSSPSSSGTGGAGGKTSTGGATGSGGATATGGKTGAGGGSVGGTTGTGGKADAGADTTTSMGGMTGGTDASDAPKDMSVATDVPADTGSVVDTGADADPAASEKAMCLTPMFMANVTTQPFSAAEFCTLYFSLCNGRVGATNFADEAACRAAYGGYNMTPDADMSPSGQQGCRSYHLCNAYNGGNPTTASLNTHCPHSTGFLPNDAGPGGPCP